MAEDTARLIQRADSLMQSFASRDASAADIRAVREGRFEDVAPGAFSEDYPAPIVANRIDTMARDSMASLSPLPSFNCVPVSTTSDGAKSAAAKRTKIVRSYVEGSNLAAQMPDAVDALNAYGLMAFHIEADHDAKMPKIRAVDGSKCYPVWDKDQRTVEVAYVTWTNIFSLLALFPEQAALIMRENLGQGIAAEQIKVVHYETASRILIYLPEAGNLVLVDSVNKLGRCSFVAVPRPSGRGTWHAIPRGAYDDLIWPMIAANEFRMLALEVTDKAVRSPLVIPPDVTDVAFGPDSVIRTSNSAGVQKLRVEVPPSAFTATSLLDQDIAVGGMSPGSRSGNINASVITGRGIDALGEGYSAQIALLQSRIGFCLEKVIQICFLMDEKFWPDTEKEIRGQRPDAPFSLKYRPSRDIAGDHTVSVDYGFLLGLDANRALVFILQAQGAGLISRSTAARYLPIQLNLDEESSQIELEQMRGSLVQAFAAMSQALPAMVAQGQDPSQIIAAAAEVIKGLKAGKEIEVITAEVFAPPPPPPTDAPIPGAPTDQTGAAPTGAAVPAVAPANGGKPDLSMMFAGLTAGGNPNLGATISRMHPVA